MSASRVPVIVGVGFHQEVDPDPTRCSDPVRSMARAVRGAAADAGRGDLFRDADSISVPRGLWRYRNPGRLVAAELGCRKAKSVIADPGVLQLTLVSELCRAIAAGEQELGIVVGGEAQFRELRAMITREPVTDAHEPEDAPPPDVNLTSSDPFVVDLESARGLLSPAALFAVIESALRRERGLGIEEHRHELAALYARFAAIAARNPHAWRRDPIDAAEIRDASAKNAMIAFPYTKRHCSNFNVNQSVALIVYSVEKADRLRLDPARRIFPTAATESRHVVPLAQKRHLHTHPGSVIAGERALALAGISIADVAHAELYSCFPAAIQCFAADLGLPRERPWSVTGGMPFAGGPFNHASLAGVGRMVEVLRESAGGGRQVGLVANLSGIFGKQACALFATEPAPGGYRFEDVTAAVAAVDRPLALDGTYAGPATIAGYTVIFQGADAAYAVAVCDLPNGARTVARSDDRTLVEAMMRDEFCGRPIEITPQGILGV